MGRPAQEGLPAFGRNLFHRASSCNSRFSGRLMRCEEEIIDDGRVEGTMIYLPPEASSNLVQNKRDAGDPFKLQNQNNMCNRHFQYNKEHLIPSNLGMAELVEEHAGYIESHGGCCFKVIPRNIRRYRSDTTPESRASIEY